MQIQKAVQTRHVMIPHVPMENDRMRIYISDMYLFEKDSWSDECTRNRIYAHKDFQRACTLILCKWDTATAPWQSTRRRHSYHIRMFYKTQKENTMLVYFFFQVCQNECRSTDDHHLPLKSTIIYGHLIHLIRPDGQSHLHRSSDLQRRFHSKRMDSSITIS